MAMTKIQVQRLFTPTGLNYKDVWVGNDQPSADKGPKYWDDYCSKENLLVSEDIGEPLTEDDWQYLPRPVKNQGQRNDMHEIKRRIDDGEDLHTIIEGDPSAWTAGSKHLAYFAQYQSHKRRRTTFDKPSVEVFYGETGTGKTRKAYDAFGYDDTTTWRWTPGAGTTFFDGYTGQDYVIFDEFRGQIQLGQILTLLDGYPTRVQIKGGSVHWSPKNIIITSPMHPKDWYQNQETDRIDQLLRRIDKVTQFHKPL